MNQRVTKAFEILVRENARMLTTYLRTLVRDEAVVDDLFQETMVVAWRRLDECDLSRPFGPWLRGIACRLAMAYYRKKQRQPVFLSEKVLSLVDQQFESISSQAADTWDEKVAALHDCLDALPEPSRLVVSSRYLDEVPTNSVAEKLNITLETCKKRLQRARRMLADCLKTKGVLFGGEAVP